MEQTCESMDKNRIWAPVPDERATYREVDIHQGCEDQGVPQGFAGGGGWLHVVVHGGLCCDSGRYSNVVHDHRNGWGCQESRTEASAGRGLGINAVKRSRARENEEQEGNRTTTSS
jgi:hypothetical protein